MKCLSCGAALSKRAKFCGYCGNNDVSKVATNPRKRIAIRSAAFAGVFLALASGISLTWEAFVPTSVPSFTVSFDRPDEIWAGDQIEVLVSVSTANPADESWVVDLVELRGSESQTIARTSFEGTKATLSKQVWFGLQGVALIVKVYDGEDRKGIVFESKPEVLSVKSASIPSSCDLPQAESLLGYISGQATAFTEDGSLDGGFACIAEEQDFGLRVFYQPAFGDSENAYESWKSWVIDGNSGPYDYQSIFVSGQEFFFDEYVPNGDGVVVVIVRAYFHGVDFDFFNYGTFDENLNYIQEAIANIPVSESP
jgi:hypothetical protein